MTSKVIVTRLHKIEGKNSVVAICDLNINGELTINGVTLNKNKTDGSYFLGFPSKVVKRRDVETKTDAKEYADICHPLTGEVRKELTELVVEEWTAKYRQETSA